MKIIDLDMIMVGLDSDSLEFVLVAASDSFGKVDGLAHTLEFHLSVKFDYKL